MTLIISYIRVIYRDSYNYDKFLNRNIYQIYYCCQFLIFKQTNSCFPVEDVRKIIQNLDSNKTYRHDNIIRMLKVCGDSICKSLEMNFSQSFLLMWFFSNRKEEILRAFTKKRQAKYQKLLSGSFTSYLWEIFERLIFNAMFSFFLANKLILPNMSGF